MRSKVAKRILEETPQAVRIFVRRYTDVIMRVNQILKSKGYTKKGLSKK